MRRRPPIVGNFSSISKEADPYDSELREQRIKESVPWSKSPFPPNSQILAGVENSRDDDAAVTVIPPGDVEWLDLLLDLAMTTALANLADNTPVDTGKETWSYVAFITLVWWIWAGQVAYNIRYRQADWFNRCCAFLQLLVLCAIGAWTNYFDITIGMTEDTSILGVVETARILGISVSQATAAAFREQRLRRRNAIGVSAVMASSRILVLVQYGVLLRHARNLRRRAALRVHFYALLISASFYLIIFLHLIVETNYGLGSYIAKIVLWYSAVLLEIIAHFASTSFKGRVSFPGDQVRARSAVLFVGVLGVGLRKISVQYKFVIGQAGVRAESVGITSITVIIIGFFVLYFRGGKKLEVGEQRKFLYFLAHLPFIAAVNITMRGIATLLPFGNLINTQDSLLTGLSKLPKITQSQSCDFSQSDYPTLRWQYWDIGLSFEDYLFSYSSICRDFHNGITQPDMERRHSQLVMDTIVFLYDQFKALPDMTSKLGLELVSWRRSRDPSLVNYQSLVDLCEQLLEAPLRPALWFCGTAGLTITLMGVIVLIRQWPRDRWEWGMVFNRIFGGAVYALLSLLDLNFGSRPPSFGTFSDSMANMRQSNAVIWRFAESGWILPSLAFLLVLLSMIDSMLSFFARRSYTRHDRFAPQHNVLEDFIGRRITISRPKGFTRIQEPFDDNVPLVPKPKRSSPSQSVAPSVSSHVSESIPSSPTSTGHIRFADAIPLQPRTAY